MNAPYFKGADTAPGTQLRAARRLRKLTQRGLAEAAHMDLDTIAGLEAGRGTVGSWLRALKALNFLIEGCGSLDIGAWLVKLRHQAGLSQEKAAISSGLSKPTIIKLERGEGRLDSLMTLLAAYRVPLQIRAVEEGLTAPKLPLEVHHGDAADVLKQFPDEHFHACITDPPYGLLASYPSAMVHEIMRAWIEGRDYDFSGSQSLMRQHWDGGVPQPTLWKEVLRVLKPGAHLAVFASPRTADLTTMALRLAGAEIRDSIAWITTGGFPRSQSVGKMLAKRTLRERVRSGESIMLHGPRSRYPGAGGRATPIPGHSLSAEEILALAPEAGPALENFSGVRSALRPAHQTIILARKPFSGTLLDNVQAHGTGGLHVSAARHRVVTDGTTRYPANVISDLPELERYYFAPKILAVEKDRYLPKPMRNTHPTVKPVALMQWLVRLLSEPGATVLDPFAGSASTGCGCVVENRGFVGIEGEQEYVVIARARIAGWAAAAERERGI